MREQSLWGFPSALETLSLSETTLYGFSPFTVETLRLNEKVPVGISLCTGSFELETKNPYRDLTPVLETLSLSEKNPYNILLNNNPPSYLLLGVRRMGRLLNSLLKS